MAYADQQEMSTSRIVSIVIVVLLHVFLGYAFVTGLAYEAVQQAKKSLNVVDVKEEEPPEEEEPPPPEPDKQIEPPVVSPPPIVRTVTPPQTIRTVDTPLRLPRPLPRPHRRPHRHHRRLRSGLIRFPRATLAIGRMPMTIRNVLCSKSVRVRRVSVSPLVLMAGFPIVR